MQRTTWLVGYALLGCQHPDSFALVRLGESVTLGFFNVSQIRLLSGDLYPRDCSRVQRYLAACTGSIFARSLGFPALYR